LPAAVAVSTDDIVPHFSSPKDPIENPIFILPLALKLKLLFLSFLLYHHFEALKARASHLSSTMVEYSIEIPRWAVQIQQ
jgi:hypothetical protein